MKQWTAIILDDQQASIDRLLEMMKDVEYVNVAKSFTDPKRALTYMRVNPIDLLILDVQLGGMSGFEFLESLPKLNFKTILYTAYPQYEDQGYQRNVVDVLLKPVSPIRLKIALSRLDAEMKSDLPELNDRDSLQHYDDYFNVKGPYRYVRTNVRFINITHVEKAGNSVCIYLNNGKDPLISNSTFENIMDKLPSRWFIKCGKGRLFNVYYFHSYSHNQIRLNYVEKLIPVGELAKHPELKTFLNSNNI